MIVTLMSNGGTIGPAMQIGEWVRKHGMLTFVPGDRTCASACALIWVARFLRTVGDIPQIGFHAAYDANTGRETGAGNAVVGAYLRDLGFGYKAIMFMTRKGPTSLEWLTPEQAKEVGLPWFKLQPPRAIPIPQQHELQTGLKPPLEVTTAWSKLMLPPVSVPPERDNETVVVKSPFVYGPHAPEQVHPASPERRNETVVFRSVRCFYYCASPTRHPSEEVRDPARTPRPATTSPERGNTIAPITVRTMRITPSPERGNETVVSRPGKGDRPSLRMVVSGAESTMRLLMPGPTYPFSSARN